MKCYCDSGKEFESCCGPLLRGAVAAETPEALMRSRYSAYHTKNYDYIESTTDPQARADIDWRANREWAAQSTFTQLEVLGTSVEKNKGVVEFRAHFHLNHDPANPQTHHEVSTFRKQAGIWYFRDGRAKK